MGKKKGAGVLFTKFVPYILLGLVLAVLLFLNLCFQDHWLDSDMAAEMMFSKLLAQEGRLVATTDWYYSTEFRVLYTQLVMAPLFLVLDNWHTIRTITNLVFYALVLASYFYFMKPFQVSRPLTALTSVVLLLPFSETMMTHFQMGNTYPAHVIILFFFLGIYLRLVGNRPRPQGRWALTGAYGVLAFLCGVSGVRYLLALQTPLVLAAFVYLLQCEEFQGFRREMSGRNWKAVRGSGAFPYFCYSLAGMACSLAGYGVNVLWVSKRYTFQTYGATNFIGIYQGVLFERLQNALGCLLMLFGYIPDRGFLSLRGVISILAFVMLGVWGYCSVKAYKGSVGMRRFLLLFLGVSFCLNLFVFVFTTSTMVPRYYITIFIFALPALAFFLEQEKIRFDRLAVGGLLTVCLALGTGKTVLSFITSDKNAGRREVARWLEEESPADFGFATYTNGNIITELTNGAVEVANVWDPESLNYFKWSSPARYYEEGYCTGQTFLLLTTQEAEKFRDAESVKRGRRAYEDEYYVVLLYDSVEQLMECR